MQYVAYVLKKLNLGQRFTVFVFGDVSDREIEMSRHCNIDLLTSQIWFK